MSRVLGLRRIDLADDPLHLRVRLATAARCGSNGVVPVSSSYSSTPSEYTSDARVDVERALGLLGAHVLGRADELAELGEQRLLGEPLAAWPWRCRSRSPWRTGRSSLTC